MFVKMITKELRSEITQQSLCTHIGLSSIIRVHLVSELTSLLY